MIYRNTAKTLINLLILICLIYGGCGRSKDQIGNEAERTISEAKNLFDQHKYQDAIEKYRVAINLNIEMSKDSALGECYLLFGGCWEKIGQYDSALGCYKNALQTFRVIGNKKLERSGKMVLAEFYSSLSENIAAAALAVDAAATAKIFSEPLDEYRTLNVAADAYHNNAKYGDEIYTINALLNLDSVLYQSRNRYNLTGRLVYAHDASGRHDLALTVFEKLKSRAMSENNDSAFVRALYEWGQLQQSSNHPDSALRAFSLAVSKMDDRMDRSLRTNILSSLGCMAFRSRHFDDARMYFTDALGLTKQSGNPSFGNLLQLMLVASDWKFGGERSSKLAPDFLKRTDDILSNSSEIGYKVGEAFALFLQARIKEKSGDTTGLFSLYLRSWQIYDETIWLFDHRGTEADVLNAFMEAESSGWYEPLLRYYYLQGSSGELFNLTERKNLRELTKYFLRLHIKRMNDKADQAISNVQWRYRTVEALEKNIYEEISAGKNRNKERLQALIQILPQRRADISNAVNELGISDPNFRWLLSQVPPTLRQIQDSLVTNCALIEYIPLSDRLLVLILTHDTVFVRAKEIPRLQLIGYIEEMERLLDNWHSEGESIISDRPASTFRIDELSIRLGSILFDPIFPLLNNISKLYLVPPEEFGWLPFHGLKVEGKLVVEKFSVNYLPTSAALLFSQKSESVIQNIIGIGNPGSTNWDVEYELKDTRSFFEKAKMVFDLSSPLNYLDTASYDLLHFAVEFNNDVDIPDNSVVAFSDVRKLYGGNEIPLGDLLRISPPQTIVFSDISPTAGELSRYAPLAFLANGTPTVIGTMWQGDRKAKKYFGEMFYTSLKAGLPASQAYHDAVSALEKKQEFSQLHRWGLFYMFGK